MSWQEELRKLDEELAAGRLSADDYRVRRDQVLSSAVAPGGQTPTPPQPAEATTVMPPVSGDDASGADKTQIVPGVAANPGQGGDSAENTQIVSSQQVGGDERTQAVQPVQPAQGGWHTARPGDMERTQAVPGVPPQNQAGPLRPPPGQPSPPGGFPQPQQQNWNQEQDDAPLWVGSEFPPLAASGSPDWVKQGPEVFDESGGGGKGKIIAIVVAVIVLAGAAFGAYWLWGRGSSNDTAGNQTATSAAPTGGTQVQTSQAPPDPQPVGNIAPRVAEDGGVSDFTAIPSRKFLTPPELKVYQNNKAGKTKLAIGELGNGARVVMLITEMPDAKSAQAAAKGLANIQVTNGMTKATDGPAGVLVEKRAPAGGKDGRYRAHYVSGNMVVRIDVNGTDTNVLLTQFNAALAAQMQVMPVNG